MFIQMFDREDEVRRRNRLGGSPPMEPTRGVFRESLAPQGETWFKVITSTGKIGLVHLPDELCDSELEENLWKRLELRDPVRQLKAV